MREDRRDLERADNPPSRDRRRPLTGDVLARVDDPTRRRRQEFGQQVEHGRLAGTVGADQCMNLPGLHVEIDVRDRFESAERLGEPARNKNGPGTFRGGHAICRLQDFHALRPIAGAADGCGAALLVSTPAPSKRGALRRRPSGASLTT